MNPDLNRILARAKESMPNTPEERERVDQGLRRFQQLEDENARRDRLRIAAPRVSDEDVEAIARGTLQETKYLVATRAWLTERNKPLLLLAGGVGAGKSVAAAWALAETFGVYGAASEVARWWADRFGRHEQERAKALRCGLLAMDDVGTELDRDSMQQALFDVVDARQSLSRRTIITTNLSKKELAKRYPDPRIWDRVGRMCTYVSSDSGSLRAPR